MMLASRQPGRSSRAAFTLAELLVTVLIIAVLGAIIVPQLTNRARGASQTVTSVSLRRLRQIIVEQYRDDMFERLPYPQDSSRAAHPQLVYLYSNPADFAAGLGTTWNYDPVTMRGWSGPYVSEAGGYVLNAQSIARGFTNRYGEHGDLAPLDGWGNPIVLQQPVVVGGVASPTSLIAARLVSAGPNGVLDTPPDVLQPTQQQQGDDLVLFLKDL